MEESIKFSVLIPYYNEGEGVIPTIESLQRQSYKNWELVCVDDGSTDNTAKILEHVSSKDSRIRVVKKDNEGTPAKAINYGIQYLTGDYYFYSSKDDFFSRDFFESAFNVLCNNDFDAVFPNLYFHYPTYDIPFFSTDDKLSIEVDGEFAAEMIAYGFKFPGNAFVKTSIVKSIGCYTFSFNSDEYTAIDYLLHCKKVGFCKSIFYYSQDDSNAFTKQLSRKRLTGLETNQRKLELFKNSKNNDLVKYLKQYNLLYYCRHLIWFFELKLNRIPCTITKDDFHEFYDQYRATIVSIPHSSIKLLLINSVSWNFYLFYFAIKSLIVFRYCLCLFLKKKPS